MIIGRAFETIDEAMDYMCKYVPQFAEPKIIRRGGLYYIELIAHLANPENRKILK